MGPRALVLGGADSLFDDLARAREMIEPDVIVACNHAGRDVDEVDHWATCHVELFPRWLAERSAAGRKPPELWGPNDGRKCALELRRLDGWLGGSSGLFAVGVALDGLGASLAILCGIPLDRWRNHYDDARGWADASNYRAAWMMAEPRLLGRVKGFDGFTARRLGVATREWIDEVESQQGEAQRRAAPD